MTAPFDYTELFKGAFAAMREETPGNRIAPAAAYLRTRIEAAFVPLSAYYRATNIRDEAVCQATARAEAAEAENARLILHVEILEEALIDHNCGSPACICVGCIEKRDAALGGEHER
jgi:hypothetical protein